MFNQKINEQLLLQHLQSFCFYPVIDFQKLLQLNFFCCYLQAFHCGHTEYVSTIAQNKELLYKSGKRKTPLPLPLVCPSLCFPQLCSSYWNHHNSSWGCTEVGHHYQFFHQRVSVAPFLHQHLLKGCPCR